LITSRSNPKIKEVRALRSRKHRDATGSFLVEGIRHVGEAVAASTASETPGRLSARPVIEALFYAPEQLESPFALDLIHQQSGLGTPCYPTTADVFDSIAARENPQGILAVVRQHQPRLEDLRPAEFNWVVALVAPQDPGNVGAILRTIDAVGASGLLLLDSSVDPYHNSAVRASMGALFWYPVVTASFADFTHWAERNFYHVYGASARGRQDYRRVSAYPKPLVLLMGSEREGLSAEQSVVCQELVRLPMRGRVSSLNLAVATGVILYAILENWESER
jgi:RNA methyltransferase, TrmH family